MKLIFGKNGAGKTTYAEKEEEKNSFVIRSSVKNWYINGKISHNNFLKELRDKKIKELEKNY